ncbi:ABC-type phosphate transport system, permease component [Thermococcus kodakarensis KOD1]|uniref:Phosphate transport system permease protein PstA n=1 Tax=Thermococcus kodakarensis (strain ATCC BAA-918 / JCM 12380 / KOD1) TaxID=69014 RepID=Q5JEQ0_THEKO|nr:phosphate ABC transporter permease PstA [Thermococcus kodakarensis]WCN27770.1 phosphate ABC transporter permease PstA [Thermococcus kodakarensis]WCN30064.1 phosphate ABC transporter permease PstA [Thermococcus kodakarensis]BAD86056.1 ABC-type phosphate transport system, permease component [Thermococcus kodakarensis KOD1]
MSAFDRKTKEKAFFIGVGALTILIFIPLFHIIATVLIKGFPVIAERGTKFLTGTLSEGGIGPAIAGTFILTFLSALLGLPVAFLVGVYAYEYPKSTLGQWTKTLLQIMIEFPTILVGVFVMQVVAVPMGTYSALAGALALAIILTPYVAVYTHEALREIPSTYREAGFSLGLTRAKVVFRILAPMAKRGILTGVLIGMAKVTGETAPLLFTAGGLYESYPTSITKPVGAVPLLIYQLVQSPNPADHATAWGASLVLLLIFLGIFIPIRLSLKEVRL